MKTNNKTVLFLLFSILTLIACSGEQKQVVKVKKVKPVGEDTLSLKVALMPTMDCLPFFVAKASGIYDSLHVPVKLLIYYAQMDCDTTFCSHRVDGMVTDLIRASVVDAKNVPLSVVMKTDAQWQLVTSKVLRIKRISQLTDRTVVVARHSETDFLSDVVAQKAKLKSNAFFRPQVNDVFLRGRMLNDNQIDAAFLPEPQASIAVDKGNLSIFSTQGSNLSLSVIAFSNKALNRAKSLQQVKLFLLGYEIAAKQMQQNRHYADSVLTHRYLIRAEDVAQIKIPHYSAISLPSKSQYLMAIDWIKKRNVTAVSYKAGLLRKIDWKH